MWQKLREHPLIWLFLTSLTVVGVAAEVWSTITRDTVPEVLQRSGWTFSGYQLLLGLMVLSMVGLQCALILRLKPAKTGVTVNYTTVEFFETRDELSRRRPLTETLESAREVWAQWNAGTQVWSHDAHRTRRVTRLLLPNPYTVGFDLLANAVKRSADDVANDVRGFTKEATKAGVEVRWFSTLPGNTLTMGDPEADSGWAHVEAVFHDTSTLERFSVRLDKKTYPRAFRHLKQSFEATWSTAMMPEKAEELERFRRSVEATQEKKTGLQRIGESLLGVATEPPSRNAARRLATLHGYAVNQLLNRNVASDADQSVLDRDSHKWMAEIITIAEEGGADISDIARLRHLGAYKPKALGHLVEPSHQSLVPGGIGPTQELIARNLKHRNEVAERIDRLLAVIERLEKR